MGTCSETICKHRILFPSVQHLAWLPKGRTQGKQKCGLRYVKTAIFCICGSNNWETVVETGKLRWATYRFDLYDRHNLFIVKFNSKRSLLIKFTATKLEHDAIWSCNRRALVDWQMIFITIFFLAEWKWEREISLALIRVACYATTANFP